MLRRVLPVLLALSCLAAPLQATWSILVLDLRTGEIVIASATCVDDSDLLQWTPVVIPGVGVAVCQAASPNDLKVLIHDRMLRGHDPERIQRRIESKYASVGGFQYAILDMQGRSLLFTGATNGAWAGGVTGQVGDVLYSIQGNVLAGAAVVDEAERAFLSAPGDLGQRVMAAMEAAAAQGGDGRCSCSIRYPDSCGTPPPNFSQSATIGYFVVSRPGDTDGPCSNNGGCANGDYYLVLNEPFHTFPSTDPVTLLRQQYDAWRPTQLGRPDAYESVIVRETERVRADAPRLLEYWIELYDLDGVGLSQGGATVELVHLPNSAGLASLSQVIDHQDGSYTLQVQSGNAAGLDRFAFRVDDGQGAVRLWPEQALLHQGAPASPAGSPTPVAGLDGFAQLVDARVSGDGLHAWLLGDRGSGARLWQSSRPDLQSAFATPQPVDVDGVPGDRLTGLWVADDGLEAVFSIREADGIQRLHAATRPDAQSPFGALDRLGPLNSDLEEAFPSRTADGRRILFQSRRSGVIEVYEARLPDHPQPAWLPPRALTALSDPGAGRPRWIDDGLRLAVHRAEAGVPAVRLADRAPDGGWNDSGPLAGAPGLAQDAVLVGWSDAAGRAWFLEAGATGPQIVTTPLHDAALQADTTSLSAGAGGTVRFDLDAGLDRAGARYRLLVGAPGNAARWQGVVLPFQSEAGLTARVRTGAGQPPLQDFVGTLDAQGRARATLTLPAGTQFAPGVLGRAHHVALVVDDPRAPYVGNAVVLDLLP